MKKTKIWYAAIFIVVFLLPSMIMVNAQTMPARNDIVWCTGYDTQHDNLNPWTGSPAFGIPFMYEPLFGVNGAKDNELIKVIGTSYSWNADGSELTVTIRDDAEWSDGESIDADDVKYSYEIAMEQPRWTGMQNIIADITVDGNDVIFHMNESKYFSFRMEQYLYTEIPIVPQHVWTEIASEYGVGDNHMTLDVTEFKNDWLDESFPDKWKVCSGPYIPYFRDLTAGEEIYKYREDWWGANKIHLDIPNYTGVPDAKFVGLRKYADNTAKDAAILTGEVDLHAGFYSSVWSALGQNDKIETWFGRSFEDYYLALGAVIEIAPNHQKYPFVEPWFREAIAYCLDYDKIETAASGGYWNKARVGIIDNRSSSHGIYYDPAVEAEYGADYNVTHAIEILDEHCYQSNGVWYTDDVPTNYTSMPGVQDDDPGHAGINVALGGYEILVPSGWTDVEIATQMWAAYITDLNITTIKKSVDFWNGWRVKIMDGDFDMVMQCCTPHLVNDPYTVLGGWRGNFNRPWDNASYWYSPEFEALWQSFDTASTLEERKEIMSDMQELLAKERPTIVSHVNGFWYLVNTENWENWPGQNNYYQDPQTAYSINRYALKQRMFLGLKVAKGSSGTNNGIPWYGFGVSITVGLAALVAIIQVRRRK